MLKVVLDTNLIVSASINPKGPPGEILLAWRNNLFELIISPQIIEEMRRVLFSDKIKKYRFLSDKEIEALLSELQQIRGYVEPTITVNVIKEDPPDNRFLEAAIAGKADYIISGNTHLKDLKSYQEIQILPPVDFVKVLARI